MPTHERIWVCLCTTVAKDASIPDAEKMNVQAYVTGTTSAEAISGRILTANIKKAYKQREWKSDMWKLELMTIPELRMVQTEAYKAVFSTPETLVKTAPPAEEPQRTCGHENVDRDGRIHRTGSRRGRRVTP